MRIVPRGCVYLMALALCGVACGEDEDEAADESAATAEVDETDTEPAEEEPAEPDPAQLAEQIGVEPGPWEVDDDAGVEALVKSAEGTVEVRRAGQEEFSSVAKDATLRIGDQLRTGAEATATVVFADETVVELAEDTVVAIGNRNARAEPAQQVAVLYGVARFAVAPRAKGEGAFLVFTPSGVVGTRGTTYAVGVAAGGDTRIGVEKGAVEVAGAADLASTVDVEAGHAADLGSDGAVGDPAEFSAEEWGEWRYQAEAEVDPASVARAHAEALVDIEAETVGAYGDLDVLTTAVSEADAESETFAEKKNRKAYRAMAPELGATVEASYLATLRLEYLTHAMLSRAYITGELYDRHPAAVEPAFEDASTRVHGAILYHKKFHGVVDAHVRPMRHAWWRHHPRGRQVVRVHGGDIEPFYRRVKLERIPAERVEEKLDVSAYHPPRVEVRDHRRKVSIGPPPRDWHAKAKAKADPPGRRVGWYQRPKAPKQPVLVGVKVEKQRPRFFEEHEPVPRPERVRIHVSRPDVEARAHVGAGVQIGGETFGRVAADRRQAARSNEKVPAKRGGSAGRAGEKVPAKRGGSAGRAGEKVPAKRGGSAGRAGEKVPAKRGGKRSDEKVPARRGGKRSDEEIPARRGDSDDSEDEETRDNEKVPAKKGSRTNRARDRREKRKPADR